MRWRNPHPHLVVLVGSSNHCLAIVSYGLSFYLKDGLICRRYTPGPTAEPVTVPLIPTSLRISLLHQHYAAPQAGHLGPDKTAGRIRQVGYWVGMLRDIEQYCQACSTCQASKPPAPSKIALTNIPSGRPWKMVAVDILQLPVSCHNNKYLLVIQDY